MKSLILDANILMRAVLGKRVRSVIAIYSPHVDLIATDSAFSEAGAHLPEVLEHRKLPVRPFMEYFESLSNVIRMLEHHSYSGFEVIARRRLTHRDEADWPVLAAALTRGCPIWTEDTDFFGCGVATWTTDRIEMYLAEKSSEEG